MVQYGRAWSNMAHVPWQTGQYGTLVQYGEVQYGTFHGRLASRKPGLSRTNHNWGLATLPQPLNSTLPHLLIGPPATDSELKSKRHLTFSNRYRSLSSHYTLLSGEGHRPKSNRLPSRGEMSRSLSTYPRVSSDKTSFVRNKSHCQILIITM